MVLCRLNTQVHFGSPTVWPGLENMTLMEAMVEHGDNRRAVAKQPLSILHRTVQRHQGTGSSLAAHDNLIKILCRGIRVACAYSDHRLDTYKNEEIGIVRSGGLGTYSRPRSWQSRSRFIH